MKHFRWTESFVWTCARAILSLCHLHLKFSFSTIRCDVSCLFHTSINYKIFNVSAFMSEVVQLVEGGSVPGRSADGGGGRGLRHVTWDADHGSGLCCGEVRGKLDVDFSRGLFILPETISIKSWESLFDENLSFYKPELIQVVLAPQGRGIVLRHHRRGRRSHRLSSSAVSDQTEKQLEQRRTRTKGRLKFLWRLDGFGNMDM